MYSLLLQLITFSSLALLIYLMARAVPRVKDEEVRVHAPGKFDALLKKLPLEKMDARLSSFSEKSLRKLRVVILKFDNMLQNYLKRVKRRKDRDEGKGPDFFGGGKES